MGVKHVFTYPKSTSVKAGQPKDDRLARAFFKSRGLEVIGREFTNQGEILIGEGFFHLDKPLGVYQTMWILIRGGPQVGRWLEFDAYHDPTVSRELAARLRYKTIVNDALKYLAVEREVRKNAH